MGAPEKFVIAYWLLPTASFQVFFRETIRGLAQKYDAPIFEPHLTLVVRPDSTDEARARLAKLAVEPIALRTIEVAWTPKFTKALFLRFDSSPLLFRIRSALGADADQDFDPHLSLLYREIPEDDQAQLAAQIQLPLVGVTFDTVAAVRCHLPVIRAADVALWEFIALRRLID